MHREGYNDLSSQKTRLIKTFVVQTQSEPSSIFGSSISKKPIFIADLVRNEHTGYYEILSSVGCKISESFESYDDNSAKLVATKILIQNAKEILEYVLDFQDKGDDIELDSINPLAE